MNTLKNKLGLKIQQNEETVHTICSFLKISKSNIYSAYEKGHTFSHAEFRTYKFKTYSPN